MSIKNVDKNKRQNSSFFRGNKPNTMSMSQYKNKQQLNLPSSYYAISQRPNSKQQGRSEPSKSFSESFLNHYINKKSTKNQNQSHENRYHHISHSMDAKNKKLLQHNIVENAKNDKPKVILNVYDNKILKQAIKTKNHSAIINAELAGNLKYAQLEKPQRSKQRNYLKLNSHTKNKSELFIHQYNNLVASEQKKVKSFLTTKNQQFKAKVIGHLQNKSRKSQINHYSYSQGKKTSQKIQQKLNSFHESEQKSFPKNIKYLSNRQSRQNRQSKNQQLSWQDKNHSQRSTYEGKLQYKYSFRTKKGKNIGNPHKVNQDSILVKQNISKKDLHMIAVADGHGPSGHFVSQFVVKSLSKLFSQEINQITKYEDPNKKQKDTLIIQGPIILPKIYDKIQNDLTCSQINAVTSGCTLVNVIIQKGEVVCANVGDSRAILARQLDKKNWEVIYLSEDHKPSNEVERKRILKSGGRVHSFKGQKGENLGPLRVWLPNQNIQGLAMTRSFGDNISKPVGVTHKPEIIRVKIDETDKFILVASDGVWEFISNQEILQLIAPFYKEKKLEAACDALLKLAYSKWTLDDDSVVDDISFVLIFLHC